MERKYLTEKLEMKKRERILRRPQMDLNQSIKSTDSFPAGGVNKQQSSSDNVEIKMPNYVVQLSTDNKKDGSIKKIQPNAPRRGSANIPVGKATIFTAERPPSTSSRSSLDKGKYFLYLFCL